MSTGKPHRTRAIELILVWGFVGIPFLYGVLETIQNALKLFR